MDAENFDNHHDAGEQVRKLARQRYITENPGSFPQFSALPPELRVIVWEYAAKPYRVHYFIGDVEGPGRSGGRRQRLRETLLNFGYFEAASDKQFGPSARHINARIGRSGPMPEGGVLIGHDVVKSHTLIDEKRLIRDSLMRTSEREDEYYAGIYRDYIDCKRGLIHVNREARMVITQARPASETFTLDMRRVARRLVWESISPFAIDIPLPRSSVQYHPTNDIFVYEVLDWDLFHQSLLEGQRRIKRLAITLDGTDSRCLSDHPNGRFSHRSSAEFTNFIRDWRSRIRSVTSGPRSRNVLRRVWCTNHAEMEEIDLIVTYPSSSHDDFPYKKMKKVFPNGEVDPEIILPEKNRFFVWDDFCWQRRFFTAGGLGTLWNELLGPFVFWIMFATLFRELRPDVKLRLRYVTQEQLADMAKENMH